MVALRFQAYILTGALSVALYAQSPVFEAAAIRLNTDPGPQMTFGPELTKGRLTALNVTLRRMVAVAYGMTEPRVIGRS
jgi:uncharacterized protein (TIGR03435 family)